MSIEEFKCIICRSTQVVSINDDLTMKFGFKKICERNNLEYNKKTVGALIKHFKDHIESPTIALARHMLHEEAIELKNTAVELNIALDQMDIMSMKVYTALEHVEDPDHIYKLTKNFTDILNVKEKYLKLHHKISGKELADELKKASLTEVIKNVSKEVGDQKVREIRDNRLDTSKIEKFLFDDEHIRAMFNEYASGVKKENEAKNKK